MADYIERQAALHAVNEFFHDPKVDIALNAVTTANVREDVQGEWIFPVFDDSDENDPRCKCSVCGSIETPLARHNFCPNCGARMVGGGER